MLVRVTGVVEREAELAALGEAIARGGVLVVAGPPGIGKSTLLRAAVSAVRQDGTRVLTAAGTPLERGFAFGTARALLEAPVAALPAGARAALLAGAARHALPVLEPGAADGLPGDLHRTLHGLHWLVAGLAATEHLALVVDDAQWADETSLRFLAYLAPRLEGLPVTLLLGVRHEGGPTGSAALDTLLAAGVLRPEALSADGVADVLAEVLGDAPGPAFAAACAARTGGSPLLVRELAQELRDAGVAPDDAHAGAVAAAVPPGVEELLLHRLAGVPRDARALADALALLGEDDPPGTARALAGLDPDAGAAAAAALAGAHLLDPADGRRLRHPLLRDAAARALPPARAGLLHGRAARLLHSMGARPARVVAHLLASDAGDGDPWAVDRLRDAARAAMAQGAAAEAAAALRRALAEPVPAGERPAVLRELGEAELAALEPLAAEHLAEALREAPSTDLAVALATAHYHASRHAEAADVLLAELDRLGEDDRERRLHLEANLGVLGRYGLETAPRLAGRLQALAEGLTGATAGERHVLAVLAEQQPGERAEGLERAALAGEELIGRGLMPGPSEGVGTVAMHLHAGHPDRAEALADRLEAMALAAGSPVRHAFAAAARVMVDLDLGRLAAAEEGSRAALAAMEGLALAPVATSAGVLLQVLAERGELAAAEEVEAAYGLGGPVPETMILNPMLYGRGVLRLAQGRDAEAAADFRELGRRHATWDMRRPSPPWRSGAALALLALGEGTEARRLADEQVALARAWGSPRSIGPALRVAALCGAPDARAAGLAAAVAALDGTPWRLELARARCDLGAELRRAGSRREARAQLEAAMGLAHACGAAPLAERAAGELRASGARPRRRAITGVDALTPSEERVARLAAAGRTNRDIAQELFITLATVETHLTRAYRKLEVPGRDELAGALGQSAAV